MRFLLFLLFGACLAFPGVSWLLCDFSCVSDFPYCLFVLSCSSLDILMLLFAFRPLVFLWRSGSFFSCFCFSSLEFVLLFWLSYVSCFCLFFAVVVVVFLWSCLLLLWALYVLCIAWCILFEEGVKNERVLFL